MRLIFDLGEPFLVVVAIKTEMGRQSQAKLRRGRIVLHCRPALELSFTPGGWWRQGKTVLRIQWKKRLTVEVRYAPAFACLVYCYG